VSIIKTAFMSEVEKVSKKLYHGSPKRVKVLMPRDEHGDPDIKEAVFASPKKEMALAYLGEKWGDRDINQGYHSRSKDGKVISNKWSLQEMRPGAFNEIYKGKSGFLYEVPEEPFTMKGSMGGRYEVMSPKMVEPIKVTEMDDMLEVLINEPGIKLIKYNPDSKEHKSAVKRMSKRCDEMESSDREEYLEWVGEKNPKLKKDIEGHM